MKLIYKSIFFATLSFLMIGCDDEFDNDVDNIVITSGDADFTKYVAIGNSLTSGYADGALYSSAQMSSYPAIVASMMKAAGGGEFKQPLMPDDIGGFANFGIPGKLQLQIVGGSPLPVPTAAQSNYSSVAGEGPYNNMGVPGAKSFHLVAPGYGNVAGVPQGLANPYFARFASSPNATVFGDVLAQTPTFFTLWIGSNDVLSFATSGGIGVNQKDNIDPSTYGGNDISSPEVVAGVVKNMAETMVSQGAKGVIANIPNVTSIPFFTTIPSKPLSPANKEYADKINTLNAFYASLNNIFDALGASDRKIMFSSAAASGIVFTDDSLEDLSSQITNILIQSGQPAATAYLIGQTFGQARQSKEGDLIPLTMSSRIAKVDDERLQQLIGMGVPPADAALFSITGLTYPKDELVLSMDEVSQIQTATDAMNAAMAQVASANGLAYLDMNSEMKSLQAGMTFNAVNYNADFITGGAFSLDGVHLNGRGYAIISNLFIDAINKKYHSNLRHVNPNVYPGTLLP